MLMEDLGDLVLLIIGPTRMLHQFILSIHYGSFILIINLINIPKILIYLAIIRVFMVITR